MKKFQIGLGVLVFVLSTVAFANGDTNKAALAKSQFMLRQVTAEKVEIEKKSKALELENIEIKKQLEKLQRDVLVKAKEVDQVKARVDEQQSQYALSQSASSEQQKELKRALDISNLQKVNLEKRVSAIQSNMSLCVTNNKQLFELNKELLAAYEKKGVWSVVKKNEPFIGSQKVKAEKYAQEFQYRLDEAVVVEQDLQ
jgi:hypothetical protein